MLLNELARIPNLDHVRKIEGIKSVLFDMDGTLLNTETLHAKALQRTLRELIPSKSFTIKELEDDFLGMSDSDVFNSLSFKNINLELFLEKKNNHYINTLLLEKNLLSKEMSTFLNDLKLCDYKIALVTASERAVAIATLEQAGFLNEFDEIICRDDLEKSKPHPLPYLTAMERLDSKHNETIIFEDSVTGLQAAKESKAYYYKAMWF